MTFFKYCTISSALYGHQAYSILPMDLPCFVRHESGQIELQLSFLTRHLLLQSHGHSASITWYTTLRLGASASNADVRRAYRQLAGKWHPDKWINKSKSEQDQASQQFADISDAYAALSNA